MQSLTLTPCFYLACRGCRGTRYFRGRGTSSSTLWGSLGTALAFDSVKSAEFARRMYAQGSDVRIVHGLTQEPGASPVAPETSVPRLPVPTVPHNPFNLTSEIVGSPEYRLLDSDEIKAGPVLQELEYYAVIAARWVPWSMGYDRVTTYRTKLTREELAALRKEKSS